MDDATRMTPYLINRTWVDLNHVQAIPERVLYGHDGIVWLAFRSEPLKIEMYWKLDGLGGRYTADEVQSLWNAFIAAWKARPALPAPPVSTP